MIKLSKEEKRGSFPGEMYERFIRQLNYMIDFLEEEEMPVMSYEFKKMLAKFESKFDVHKNNEGDLKVWIKFIKPGKYEI